MTDSIVRTKALKGVRLVGRYSPFSIAGIREGVVVARYFIDSPDSISRKFMEYDVRDMRTNEIYSHCRRLHTTGGFLNGTDEVLQPATKPLTEEAVNFDPKVYAPMQNTNGDRVALGFVSGAHTSAVIMGVFPHALMDYGTLEAEGHSRFTIHEGTSLAFQEDGTFRIARNIGGEGTPRTTITVRPNGDIEIDHNSTARLHLLEDGTLRVDGVDADGVRLGFAAIQHVVKGETADTGTMTPTAAASSALNSALATLLAAYAPELVAAALGSPPTPLTTNTVAAIMSALIAYAAAVDSAMQAFSSSLSDKVVTE